MYIYIYINIYIYIYINIYVYNIHQPGLVKLRSIKPGRPTFQAILVAAWQGDGRWLKVPGEEPWNRGPPCGKERTPTTVDPLAA